MNSMVCGEGLAVRKPAPFLKSQGSNGEIRYKFSTDAVLPDLANIDFSDSFEIIRRFYSPFSFIQEYCLEDPTKKSMESIKQIEALEDNWNDNGAKKFSQHIIEKVEEIVRSLSRQPDIFPTANESIQFEYENETGDYLEFELFEDDKLKKFYCGHDDQTSTEFIDISEIDGEVRKFYKQ